MEEIVHDEKAEEEEEEEEDEEEEEEEGGRIRNSKGKRKMRRRRMRSEKRNGVNMDLKNIYRIGRSPTDGWFTAAGLRKLRMTM